MESEQGLAAKEPMALDFENENLPNTSQIAKKTHTVDATDVLQIEIEYGSQSSPKADEVPEASSEDPIREVLFHTSELEEDGIVEHSDNINNGEGINPEEASIGAKASLLGTEPDDARRKNQRAPRYFDPPEYSWQKYGENNDGGKKHKKKRKTCYICADTGHEGQRCKRVNDCFICSKKGHLAVDCPNKNVDVDCTSRLCLRCGNTGHDMFSCTNDYDPEDLKSIKCYICQEVGHLCCVENKTEGPREASCYNCGQSGHFGLDCTKPNEVAIDLQPLCPKCGDRGHTRRKCNKAKSAKTATAKDAAAVKAAKRKARNARRRNKTNSMPTINAYQSQPIQWWSSQIVGPYYGNPGSNVWLSPAAAAARSNLNRPIQSLPNPQPFIHQVAPQIPNSFDSLALRPHLYSNFQNGTQITKLPLNQETGNMLPQRVTQTQQNSFYPMTQLPHLIWNSPQRPPSHPTPALIPLTGNQIPNHPFSRQTGVMLPHQVVNHPNMAPLPLQNIDIAKQN